jgi:hypothetical protein
MTSSVSGHISVGVVDGDAFVFDFDVSAFGNVEVEASATAIGDDFTVFETFEFEPIALDFDVGEFEVIDFLI